MTLTADPAIQPWANSGRGCYRDSDEIIADEWCLIGLPSTLSFIDVVRWRIVTVYNRHNVASLGLVIEMQLDPTRLKLPEYNFDSLIDGRVVRAVASNKLLNNSPECRKRQFRVWDAHRISLLLDSWLRPNHLLVMVPQVGDEGVLVSEVSVEDVDEIAGWLVRNFGGFDFCHAGQIRQVTCGLRNTKDGERDERHGLSPGQALILPNPRPA